MTELGKLFQIFTMRAEKNAFVSHTDYVDLEVSGTCVCNSLLSWFESWVFYWCFYWLICLQKYRAAAFAAYSLTAVTNIIGMRAVLTSLGHMTLLCSAACFTASPLCVWIISALFLLSFQIFSTQNLMVCEIFCIATK